MYPEGRIFPQKTYIYAKLTPPPTVERRPRMPQLILALLPAALSYLTLRVCLTVARTLSASTGGALGAVIYMLAAALGYAAAIFLLRRFGRSETVDAAEIVCQADDLDVLADDAPDLDAVSDPSVGGAEQTIDSACAERIANREPKMQGCTGPTSEHDSKTLTCAERESHKKTCAGRTAERIVVRCLLTVGVAMLVLLLSRLCALLPGGNYSPASPASAASLVSSVSIVGTGMPIAAAVALLLLRSAVFPAVCEELYYRRSLCDAFRAVGAGRWCAYVCVALLFAVSHVGGGLSSALLAGLSSVVLSVLRERSDSVACPVAAHLIYNAAVLLTVM